MKPSIAIIGCGKVGTSLGAFLYRAGYPIAGLASRTAASVERASEVIGSGRAANDSADAAKSGEVVLITTPDDAIADACAAIAARGGFRPGHVVLHCSGALPSTLLADAAAAGAAVGSLHPLQSFAGIRVDANPFEQIIMAIEGDDHAVSSARSMADDLGAIPITIRTEGKVLYHAAAVAASNYLVTLMGMSLGMLENAGIDRQQGFSVLAPLIHGTLGNIDRVGIPDALTGPIARGDVETVAAHVRQIRNRMPDRLSLYCRMGLDTVEIALAKGGIDEAVAEDLRRVLTGCWSG